MIYVKIVGSNVYGIIIDEILKGMVYDDMFNGGGGYDILIGGDGLDIYLFKLGDGDVMVDDVGLIMDLDVVVFGVGIMFVDIFVSYNLVDFCDFIFMIGFSGDKFMLKY